MTDKATEVKYMPTVYGTVNGVGGYLRIPFGEGDAYFYPWSNTGRIVCPAPDTPKSLLDENPFYPFVEHA